MLTVEKEKSTRALMIHCTGRLVRGEQADALRDAVLSEGDARVIMLDLSAVDMIDAGGLSTLIVVHDWAEERGIKMKVVNPSHFVLEILMRTGLDRVFEVSTFNQAIWVLSGLECSRHATA